MARATWGFLAGLAAAEGTWSITYNLVGEAKPTVWLLPTLAAMVAGVIVFRAGHVRTELAA